MAEKRIDRIRLILSGIIAISVFYQSCESTKNNSRLPDFSVTGEITRLDDVFGPCYYYIPPNADQNTRILVLVHGTPKDLLPDENAYFYIKCWLDFALNNNFILLAPAFNQEDFSSRYGDRALSGYRGLFGRKINADDWVLRLVGQLQLKVDADDRRICLYGHSAGGQFVSRFLVMHPEEVRAAVITSAATYPQPVEAVVWPFGLGELHSLITWDDGTSAKVDIVPETEKWLGAAEIPLTVIVGMNDTEILPAELIPGQNGRTRYAIAGSWVDDFSAFAGKYGRMCNFTFEIIPGVGHSMTGLQPFSRQALLNDCR